MKAATKSRRQVDAMFLQKKPKKALTRIKVYVILLLERIYKKEGKAMIYSLQHQNVLPPFCISPGKSPRGILKISR